MKLTKYQKARLLEYNWDVYTTDDGTQNCAWISITPEDGKIFGTMLCKDRYGRPVLLFRNSWKIESVTEENKNLKLVPWAMAPEYDVKSK